MTLARTAVLHAVVSALLVVAASVSVWPVNELVRQAIDDLDAPPPRASGPRKPTASVLHEARLRALLGLAQPRPDPAPLVAPFEGRLLGTLTASAPEHSVATFVLPTGHCRSAWEGDVVLDAQIVHIDHGAVTLRRGEHLETLLTHSRASPPLRSSELRVPRALVEHHLANLAQLSNEVQVLPAFREGRPAGFRLLASTPDWTPGRLGLRPGDVIRAVNGVPLDSAERVLELASRWRSLASVDLEVERAGAQLIQRYRLE